MSFELQSLKPAETFTVTAVQPDTGETFALVLASPFTAEGEAAVSAMYAALQDAKGDAAAVKRIVEAFTASLLRALPDVTVDGQPLVVRDAAHAAEVLADLPYLVPQIEDAYMERLRFLAARRTRSSSTPPINAVSTAA